MGTKARNPVAKGNEGAKARKRQAKAAERLGFVKKSFGAQFTEREGKLLEDIQASTGKSKAANKRLLTRAAAVNARAKARAAGKKKTISGLARNAAARPESTFRKRTGGQLTEKEGNALRKRGARFKLE